ncbi:hypothetical protein HYQ46_012035 [Verticillium longisporum]|nr:hypothetical protein HYQ46_012035 [Verticillium longisporum]
MKFSLGVAAALAGFTSALQPADVYILQSKQASTSETPSLPRQVARLILLQRLAPEAWTDSLNDIPEDVTTETAVSYINRFGKSPQPLFDNKATSEPSQLLVMLEGISTEDAKSLKKTLKGSSPAFEVNDAPSSVANHNLAQSDMASAGRQIFRRRIRRPKGHHHPRFSCRQHLAPPEARAERRNGDHPCPPS